MSASTITALLGGCSGRSADAPAHEFVSLDADQQALVARLVDLVIPQTDTPGALAAGADEFIDKMLSDWMPDDERDAFLAGLATLDARARSEAGAPFVQVDAERQVALLTALDAEAYQGSAAQARGADTPFMKRLKELTLAGYYTSEIGATQELQWIAMPGRYDGDVPLTEVGRAWA